MAKVMAAACLLLVLILTALFVWTFLISPGSPDVTLVSLNVGRLNFTSAHISGYVDMHFQVTNGNMLTDFSYDDVSCSIYHGKRLVASTMFPGFLQRAWETKPINITVYLTPLTAAREVRKEPYALEEFGVELVTFIKWRFGSSSSVRVSCDKVPVGLVLTTPGHGKMIGPARKCQGC